MRFRIAQLTLLAASAITVSAQGQIGNITFTSGASFYPGLPSQGSIGTIFCTGLSVQGVIPAETVPLPTSIADVTVTVGGVPAPLFAVADLGDRQQINFQVPFETKFNADGTAQIVVSQSGAPGSAAAKNDPKAPGEFFRIDATPMGVFFHALDSSVVTTDNPASAGETIIGYLTGLPTTGPSADGYPIPASPPFPVLQTHSDAFSDYFGTELSGNGSSVGQLDPPFLGLLPGSVGVYQLNFTVPSVLSTGSVILCRLVLIRYIGFCPSGPGLPPCTGGGVVPYASQLVLIPVR